MKTEEDKEDEEIVTDVRHSGLDPITKKQIQNPVQHKVHSQFSDFMLS